MSVLGYKEGKRKKRKKIITLHQIVLPISFFSNLVTYNTLEG
jgi:hypothetical protein